jgi:glutamine amidotransferase
VIALLDYGSGNLRSVQKALIKAGAEVKLVQRAEEVGAAEGMVLPGVGAFDDCVNAMEKQELLEATREFIKTGRPFLGICVGYQALFERSEEFNSSAAGLGIFRGNVVRFSERVWTGSAGVPAGESRLKIPQIGWNQLEIVKPECPLYRGIADGSYVYFVHSFFPKPLEPEIVATQTEYGQCFASSVWRENVFATQFHPEKSQAVGLRLLSNFVELTNHGRASVPGFKAAPAACQ